MSNDYYEEYLAKTNDNLRESTLLKQEKKKFSSKKPILLTLLFLVLGGEGFYLWQKNQETKSSVDNPTEALLPMTKPTIIILDTNHSLEKNITKPIVKIIPKIVEKNTTKPIVKIVPKTVEKNTTKPIVKIVPKIVEKNTTKPIIKIVPKIVEKNTTKPIVKIVPKIVEKNTTKPIVKISPKIHPLEQSLLNAEKIKKSTMKNGKKIDTFNKIILDRSISKGSETSQKISKILKDAKKKKEEVKEKKKVLPKKKISSYTKAIKKEAKVRKDEMRYVTVKSGDSLYKIAKRIYGDSSKFDIIFKANSDVLKKATDLSIGQKLRVPKIKKAK